MSDNRSARPGRPAPGSSRRIVRRIGNDFETIGENRYQNCNLVEFDGHEYVFSHRAILTLVTTAACNAACKFCSNEITFTPSGPYLAYSDRLERALAFAEVTGVTKVAFTGGEPTAAPQKLYNLVSAVAPRFTRARLHTNGFGLQHPVDTGDGQRSLLTALADAGLTGVSVSVASHRLAENRKVMAFKGRWLGLSEEDLIKIARSGDPRLSTRLSCVLTPESVHTVDGIREYIDWGADLGFRSFIFRSCSLIPEEFSKVSDFSSFNTSSNIPIEPIVSALRQDPQFEETFAQHKSDSHVHAFRRADGITFDVDQSGEEEDPDPKIRRLNIMPDGVTYTSWIDPRSLLFPDEREQAMKSMRRELPLLPVHKDDIPIRPGAAL